MAKYLHKAILLYLLLCSLVLNSLQAEPVISVSQTIQVREKLINLTRDGVNAYLTNSAINVDQVRPEVIAEIIFNEEQLKKDYETFVEKIEKEQIERHRQAAQANQDAFKSIFDQQLSLVKAYQESQSSTSTGAAGASLGSDEEFRFGRLNISLDRQAMQNKLSHPTPGQGQPSLPIPQVSLSLQLPSTDRTAALSQFTIDPFSYLQKINLTVRIPDTVPTSLDAEMIDFLHRFLGLKEIKNLSQDSAIKIERRQNPATPTDPHALVALIKPFLLPLSLLLAAVFLGFISFSGIKQVAKTLAQLAANLLTLKPADESAPTMDASWVDAGKSDSDRPQESEAQQAASTQALTQEMKNIREQLRLVVDAGREYYAERLLDILASPAGMADFRELLSFVGYQILKPAMDLLPEDTLYSLRTYIEDTRHSPTSLLRGVEIAQGLYRDSVGDISKDSQSQTLANLRTLFLAIDDKELIVLAKDLTAKEIGVILKFLSMDRGAQFMRKLPNDVLHEACDFVDQELPDLAQVAIQIETKVRNHQTSATKKHHEKKRRLILKLAQDCSLKDEASIAQLIPETDWTLRSEIMRQRFFFLDLLHLPVKNKKALLESFDNRFKAQLLFLLDEEIKVEFLKFYAPGTKLRELLDAEIAEIEQNGENKKNLMAQRDPIIETFMKRVRLEVQSNPSLVDLVIINICRAKNLAPPAHLHEAVEFLAQEQEQDESHQAKLKNVDEQPKAA